MSIQTTTTLKSYFETRDRPTQAQFADLIDSLRHQGGPEYRTAEYFGAVAVAHGATPSDNLAAINAAIEWSSNTGGCVVFGPGVYGVAGTLTLLPYATLRGISEENTVLRQLAVATSDLTTYATLMATPTAAQGGSFAVNLSDMCLDGGWSLRDFEGKVGQTNWGYDPTRFSGSTAQRLILLDCPVDGPTHAAVRGFKSDVHHRFDRLKLVNCAGPAMEAKGRGEIRTRSVTIEKAAHGIWSACVDNWWNDITAYTIGDSGMKITGGNQRIANSKFWFTGMQKAAECVGAGVEIDGPGVTNITMVGVTTQDTWGPGFRLEGDGCILVGAIDEAGGGRVEQQGFGFAGTRTLPRTNLRVANLVNSRVRVSVTGGARSAAPPNLIDFRDGGAEFNDFEMSAAGATLASPVMTAAAGLANSKRFNRVWRDATLIYGRVTTAHLADAAHAVNRTGGPSVVELSPSGMAARGEDGAWRVLDVASTVTPA